MYIHDYVPSIIHTGYILCTHNMILPFILNVYQVPPRASLLLLNLPILARTPRKLPTMNRNQ